MALAALIIASEPIDGGGDLLRATLPLLGRTLVEHQVRQAVGAGAGHVVLLVERMPAALTAALDRLRRDGIAIEVARSIADAADRFHPDERLLLVADGCVADQVTLDALAALVPPALVTLLDQADTADYERIDAHCRWAGLALLDGGLVRSTAAMLGDWDPQSTLLRRAVQDNARRVDAGQAVGDRPRIAAGLHALDGLDRRLLRGSRVAARRWPRRWLFGPLEGPVAGWLARRAVDPLPIALAAVALAALGATAIGCGWLRTGLGFGLLSGPVAAIAVRLARLRLATIRQGAVIERSRLGLLAIGLFGIAATLPAWGWLLTAGMVVATMLALALALNALASLSDEQGPPWIANGDALGWILLPVAAGAGWGAGLAALLGYAALSFVRMQTLLVATARRAATAAAV